MASALRTSSGAEFRLYCSSIVSMFMHVLVFMTVGLSLCMGMLVVMDVLMRMSAFHG